MSAYHSKRKTGRVGSPIEIDHLAVVGDFARGRTKA